MIKEKTKYKIKGKSKYFLNKYGTNNPIIKIESEDEKVFGGSWTHQTGNMACIMYALRAATEDLPLLGRVYYGKIDSLGELVHESELEKCG